MAFPSASLVPPALGNYCFKWQGLTIGGAGSPYQLTKIEGVHGMPNVRSGDAARPRDHGSFIGLDLLPARDVVLTIDVGPPFGSAGTLQQALLDLSSVMAPANTTEEPLYYAEGGLTYAAMVRPRRNSIPTDITYVAGSLARGVALQFTATDPRWYSTPTLIPGCGLPAVTSGLSFPLSFPLSFGSGSLGNSLVLDNTGNLDCRPIFTVSGLATSPVITNTSIPGSPSIGFAQTVNAGDVMVVDADLHTAVYYPGGGSVGYTVLGTLKTGSTWFSIVPGNNDIIFNSSDSPGASGTVTVAYASAYLL